MLLPITLTVAGAAAVLNLWLAMRVGQVRQAENVSVGDGGAPALIARMRAHANYAEYTPFVLVLIAVIELAVGSQTWLWIVGGVYLLARVAHGIGMDGKGPGRMIGTVVTFLTLLGLAGVAISLPYLRAEAGVERSA